MRKPELEKLRHAPIFTLLFAFVLMGSVFAAESLLLQLPDVNQLEGGANGRADCGPAAVANYLYFLKDHGFPEIVSSDTSVEGFLTELEKMMKTDSTGTGVRGLATGVSSYFESKGYQISKVTCSGWRRGADGKAPDLDRVKQVLENGGGVFLNFGWYKSSGVNYSRTGGHWATLVGFGLDQKGNYDESVLIIHDPSPRCGSRPRNEYLHLKVIEQGDIEDPGRDFKTSAFGYQKVVSGWVFPQRAETAILDAVVCILPSAQRKDSSTKLDNRLLHN